MRNPPILASSQPLLIAASSIFAPQSTGSKTARRCWRCDGVLTGVHEPGTSHFSLLAAFAPRALLEEAHALAEERGYQGHEFGDAMLILGRQESRDQPIAAAHGREGRRQVGVRT